ncbi:hypothetical protein C8J57DRAFT_1679169 [Mycena rebaudengoi]|nr:hypothetical protein C8J57DRAFT_1679169 [Mycena rebaudengoi]
MRALAEKLANSSHFGGSFFFKRGHPTCGNAQKLFPTLAYQLADNLNVPQLRARVSKIVADIPSVVSKSLKVQLQKLITGPCTQLDTSQPITIIIDGLDECNDSGVQQEVLRCIGYSIRKQQDSFPLQFLIASRPEPHIHEIFQGSLFHTLHHSFNVDQSFEDVEKYLVDEFARIHREHHLTMAGVSSPWPSKEVVKALARKSSGYFIYAVTVIKFVDDKNFRPTEQLDALQHASHLESPFSALDQLYTQILLMVPTRYRHSLLLILQALEFFEFAFCIGEIEQLLQLKAGDVQLILRNLHSVLRVPEPENNNVPGERISVHHASFRDFLNNQAHSADFYVGGLQHQVEMGKSVLKALSYLYDNQETNLAGPVACTRRLHSGITKIPPLPEMIPQIRVINPDYFFFFYYDSPKPILSLLKNIGDPPEDLVQLWEDYHFMFTLQATIDKAMAWTPAYRRGDSSETNSEVYEMRKVLWFVAEHLSPEIVITQLSLELAQACVRLLSSPVYSPVQLHSILVVPWGRFIRISPYSLELLQDICQASFNPNALNIVENSPENYHDTLQWLKGFPDPPQDVIEVWEQYLIGACKIFVDKWGPHDTAYDHKWEWRNKWQANYEKWFPHLRRQNSGK